MSLRLSDCTSPAAAQELLPTARSLQPAKAKTKGKLQLLGGCRLQAGARGSPAGAVPLKATRSGFTYKKVNPRDHLAASSACVWGRP